MSAYEITPRQLHQVGQDRWEGLRTIITNNSEVQFYASSMFGQVFPGMSGPSAPTIYKSRAMFEYRGIPGVAAIMFYYETARDPSPQGRAYIQVMHTPQGERVIFDLDGKVVADGYPADDGLHHWQLIRGTDVRPRPGSTTIFVKTAADPATFNLASTLGRIGFVNDSVLVNFGGAEAQTLLLVGLELRYQWGQEVINLDYVFRWDPRGWNDAIKVLKGAWAVTREPSFAWDQGISKWIDVSTQNYVLKFFPGWERQYSVQDETWSWIETDPESRRVFETADFGDLDSRVVW